MDAVTGAMRSVGQYFAAFTSLEPADRAVDGGYDPDYDMAWEIR